MGYYRVRNQLAVEPEVPGGSDVTRKSDSVIEEPPPITSTSAYYGAVVTGTDVRQVFNRSSGGAPSYLCTAAA